MAVRAPDSGLSTLNIPQDGRIDTSQRGIAGFGDVRRGGLGSGTAAFDGESVLASDAWEGSASRSLPRSSPSAYAAGPDLSANIERGVDYILSPLS